VFINKYNKKNEKFLFIKDSFFFDFINNLLQIKKELLDNSYLKK
jgi:hypothetical protein